jgi:hypothetical protein
MGRTASLMLYRMTDVAHSAIGSNSTNYIYELGFSISRRLAFTLCSCDGTTVTKSKSHTTSNTISLLCGLWLHLKRILVNPTIPKQNKKNNKANIYLSSHLLSNAYIDWARGFQWTNHNAVSTKTWPSSGASACCRYVGVLYCWRKLPQELQIFC